MAAVLSMTAVAHGGASALDGDRKMANPSSDGGAAEQSYREAITVAKGQSAKTLRLRAARTLARPWRDQAKRGRAYDLLAPVYGWFTKGFERPYLKDAKALLEDPT